MTALTTSIGEAVIHTLVALVLSIEAAVRMLLRRPAP